MGARSVAQHSEKFVPEFPHAHYHSYAVQEHRLVDINPNLQMRAEDIATICNRLGARSVMDVGSNLGGFLFYLEQFGDRSRLLGIEGDKRFVEECHKVSDRLRSRVRFLQQGVMSVDLQESAYDTMILQNVYHYIYDKVSNHREIFAKFRSLARSIVWYNPMSKADPVIGQHANSNPQTDWDRYSHADIFRGAIAAGYLHPLPDRKSRFGGMGSTREHWIFVADDVRSLKVETMPLANVQGVPVEIRQHFRDVHSVSLDAARSYKVFKEGRTHLAEGVLKSVQKGTIDASLCPDLRFIVDGNGKIVGYSQPRGTDFLTLRQGLGEERLNNLVAVQQWRLFSRMIRNNTFNHDVGPHNFVMVPGMADPMLIDLENFVHDASTVRALSVYRLEPNDNEVRSAEANLGNLFPDVTLKIEGRNSIDILVDVLLRSNFLSRIDYTNVLSR